MISNQDGGGPAATPRMSHLFWDLQRWWQETQGVTMPTYVLSELPQENGQDQIQPGHQWIFSYDIGKLQSNILSTVCQKSELIWS